MKSRVKGDFHARFRENAMVKVHGVTQLCASKKTQHDKKNSYFMSDIHYF